MKLHWFLAFTLASLVFPLTSLCQDGPAKAAPEPVYRVGEGVKPPRKIYGADPVFPHKACRELQQGVVELKMVVGANGLPRDIKVQRSLSPDLDEAAMDAVKKWKFAPGTKDGEPVAVQISVEVSFHAFC